MLENYDRGEPVFTIEMGGLGPGYEQCIQMLTMEIIRDYLGKPGPEGEYFGKWADDTVSRTDKYAGGYSGAQVGAAKWLAYQLMKDGPAKVIERFPADRHIRVSNFFPTCPKC